MGDTNLQLDSDAETSTGGPTFPPRILRNLIGLAMAQTLGWVLFAVLALFQKIGLPVESIVLPLGLIYGWIIFQILNVLCIHTVTTRWLRAPIVVGLLLANVMICLMPAMMLSGTLNNTTQSVVVSDSLLLTLLTAFLLLCHGAATLFLVAPTWFEQLFHRLPILGPLLKRSPCLFPQVNANLGATPTALPYDPSSAAEPLSNLIGQEAVLRSALRPWGKLRLDRITYEVKSEGSFIDAGTRVRVARVDDGYVVVVPVEIG